MFLVRVPSIGVRTVYQRRDGQHMLVFAALAVLHAFDDEYDPAVLDDVTAMSKHPYLRRESKCSATARAALPALMVSKTIHQIWWQGKEDVPAHFQPLQQSWDVHHKNWQHKLWDESAIVALVNESYQWFAPTFHALPSKIQKADAARYVILHHEGGIYADLDVEAFRNFDELIESKAIGVMLSRTNLQRLMQ